MRHWAAIGPIALFAASGCLASKSDIQLLQDEFRATRAQLAQGDTSILRADDARRSQIAQLSANVNRLTDSLRVLAAVVASFQATATGQFEVLGNQIIQIRERQGETTKNLQDTRAQLQALREQAASAPPPQPAASTDTSQHAVPAGPGPAILFTTAYQQLKQGSYNVAKNGFDQLLTSYPTYEQAPAAQLWVGEAYKNLGNMLAADSVYQLVATKYPGSPEAAGGLFRHAKLLWDAGKKADARPILTRVVKEYPNSDEAGRAKALLGER